MQTSTTDRFFVGVTSALESKSYVMLTGQPGSGRVCHLKYLAELMGRSCVVIQCNSGLDSCSWLLEEYLKIAAGGLMMVFK